MDKEKTNWQKVIRNAQKMKSEPDFRIEPIDKMKKNIAEPKINTAPNVAEPDIAVYDTKNKKFENLALAFQQKKTYGYRDYQSGSALSKDGLNFLEKRKNDKNFSHEKLLLKKNELNFVTSPNELEEKVNINETSTAKATMNTSMQDYLANKENPTKVIPVQKNLDATVNVNTMEYLGSAGSDKNLPTVSIIRKEDAKTVQTSIPQPVKEETKTTSTVSKEDPIGLIGTILHRKFKIIGFLGQGGMGAVYLGENVRINQKVAIKILIKSAQVQQADLDRFNKEASIAAKIKHNNIVQVYDLDETDHFHYIVMEYVEGKSLDSYMRENGVLSVEEASYVIKNAAIAFQVIHDHGVVHRDIKPANFMLTNYGEVKIMDFGIVKELGATVEITGTSTIIGTPQFMAPEMISKTLIDYRSDIYSLGATFYFLLTGKYCFTGTTMQLMFQVVNTKPVPPEEYNPKIPPGISKIIMKMLEKQHADRYQSMQEVYNALVNFEQEYCI